MAETITKRQAIRNAEKENARKEGIQEGIQEEARRIASYLLQQNMKISFIIEVTQLSKEEIESLKNDLSHA